MQNGQVSRPPVVTEHEKLERLLASAFAIRKQLNICLDNTRSTGEDEGKGEIKNISRTVHDKMVELQETLEEIHALANELDSNIGCHQDLQKGSAVRSA